MNKPNQIRPNNNLPFIYLPSSTSPSSYLLMQRQHHVREACKLKQHKEDELGGEVLPQQLACAPDIGVKVFLGLGALHGVHHEVHQLLL